MRGMKKKKMKVQIFSLVLLGAYYGTEVAHSKDEFLAHAEHNFLPSKLPVFEKKACSSDLYVQASGHTPCYAAATRNYRVNRDSVVRLKNKMPLVSLLYLYAGSLEEASKLLRTKQYDFGSFTAMTDPNCSYVFRPLQTLGPTFIGPGSIGLSKAYAKEISSTVTVGGSMEVSTPDNSPFGIFHFKVSAEYEKGFASSVSRNEGYTFEAAARQPCTPSMLSGAVACKATRARFIFGRGSSTEVDEVKEVDSQLIPAFNRNSELFDNKYGCVDYTRE